MDKINFFLEEGVTSSNRVLHTPSSFAKNNLTYVQEAGTLKSLKPHWCERDNVESYLFMFVKSGNGILRADGDVEYEIEQGDCIWVDCRKPYAHRSSEENQWELMWVHFNGAEVKAYYDFFRRTNKTPVFRALKPNAMTESLEEIIGLQSRKDVYGEFESALALRQLMTLIMLEMKSKEQKVSQELFEAVRAYIVENYTNDNLIKEIKAQFETDGLDIQAEFKKRYGLELWDYILNRKFTVAKELLRFTIKPVEEIVEESGIRNTDLFYQLFKENEGVSPEEYRRNWAQWIK
ncbi:MAG: AraC family transcriptional regulator [Lachnospiraceae bacterium]|nr:AraC family transcriptional regulator [Lachnospiraceae bacterium]